jgi:ketosteroid isomerase-like protein
MHERLYADVQPEEPNIVGTVRPAASRGVNVAEVDDFLAEVLPTVRAADVAFHNGDDGPRMALWSHETPVTFFGANLTKSGWDELAPAFASLASKFSHLGGYEVEIIAAGISGDLGYIVAKEHETTTVHGAQPEAYTLRATTIFRREHGQWRQVHRHADPVPDSSDTESARRQLSRLDEPGPAR